jgi:hypothetical protein
MAQPPFFADILILRDGPSPKELHQYLRFSIKNYSIQLLWSGVEHDNCGVLYWLATNGYTTDYENPHLGEKVKCTSDIISGGEIEQLNTASVERPWFLIDLTPSDIKVIPTHYRIGTGHNGAFLPIHWVFQGSTNGVDFVDLYVHDDDHTLSVHNPIHTFPLNCTEAFSYFKLIQTGDNSYGVTLFMVCAVEIYGTVLNPPKFTQPPPNIIAGTIIENENSFNPDLFSTPLDDKNGILYWIGSNCIKGSRYINPYRSKKVDVTSSDLSTGKYETFVGREIKQLNTGSQDNGYFAVDLGPSKIKVKPTAYRLGSGHNGSFLPRSWKFEGSNDGGQWTTIREHDGDSTLTVSEPIAIFPVNARGTAYSHFRLVQTGPNSYGATLFMACCFELYGTVYSSDHTMNEEEANEEAVIEEMAESEGMSQILEGLDKKLFVSKVTKLIKRLKGQKK